MLIDDNLLAPYQIIVDNIHCTLVEPTANKDAKGNTITKIHGYYGTVEGALLKAAKLKVENKHDVITIKKYVSELRATTNELLTLISID